MKTVNIHAAKTNLSKLIAEIESGGGDIVIARAGKPVARLTAAAPEKRERFKLGSLRDKIKITGDIISPNVEIWEGTVAEYKDLREDGTPYAVSRKKRPATRKSVAKRKR